MKRVKSQSNDINTVNNKEMTFLEHLEELRWRIIKSLLAVVILAIPCGIFWKRILSFFMLHPLRFSEPQPKLIVTTPGEAAILSIKVAVIGGLIAASPIIFYQFWSFIGPGLYKKEKQIILPAVFYSTISFLLGLIFSYFCLPYIFKVLGSFGGNLLQPYFRAQDYLGFVIKICLAFGIVFELPIVAYVLAKLGIINHTFLLKYGRYFIVAAFILAAILTPPDVISQLFMAIPLLALYGISILVAFLVSRKSKS